MRVRGSDFQAEEVEEVEEPGAAAVDAATVTEAPVPAPPSGDAGQFYYATRFVDAGREATWFLGIIFGLAFLWAVVHEFFQIWDLLKQILTQRYIALKHQMEEWGIHIPEGLTHMPHGLTHMLHHDKVAAEEQGKEGKDGGKDEKEDKKKDGKDSEDKKEEGKGDKKEERSGDFGGANEDLGDKEAIVDYPATTDYQATTGRL
jgi:hypothetical protein